MGIYLDRSKRIEIEGEISSENQKIWNQYYRAMKMKGLSEKTIYNYQKDLEQWFKFMNQKQFGLNVLDATEDDISEFLFYCQEQGNNANRIKRRMSAISALYIFLKKKKLTKENPVELLDRPTNAKPVVVQTYLSMDNVKAMKEKLKEFGDLQLQTYALFSLSTMARVNAICNLKWKQINFEENEVSEVLEKGDKIVDLFFSDEVKELLLKLKAERKNNSVDCEHVFISKRNGQYKGVLPTTLGSWSKKVGKMIELENGLHPHDFRHSGATLLKNLGMPLEEVSVLLNHNSTDTTRKFYIKEDNKKLKDSKAKFGI
ncbi:tyrosine-type recombinase/integrase [Paraclostridium sordellii]|uniref:tyrosine-type recombinase/integrase n=1 Tax=Paraclostridium sordellii TaxID=1505 RepID=UPI0022E12294|nr:tyrosine-type recombinase/integrase [Paeniclostridium sordellii]